MTIQLIWLALLLLLGSSSTAVQAIKEPRTGLDFQQTLQRQSLVKLGVRTKGPIKVYAVGLYGKGLFLLKMHLTVSASKMTLALKDALQPRCRECDDTIAEFETLLLKGLPAGASKGTRFLFDTTRGRLTLSINEKQIGTIRSKSLAQAFAGIYTDRNAVCQLKAINGDDDNSDSPISWRPVMASLVVVGGTTLFLFYHWCNSRSKSPSITELNVYPIKSCAAQSMQNVRPTLRGFQHDRVFQITDRNRKYCTPRDTDKARLFHVTPTLDDDDTLQVTSRYMPHPLIIKNASQSSNKKQVSVEVLECPDKKFLDDCGNEAAQWMQDATNIRGCRLTGIGTSFTRDVRVNDSQGDVLPTPTPPPVSLADEAPYLLTSTASLTDLNRRLQQRGKDAVDMRRFRPNIVVSNVPAWQEDTWKRIRVNGNVEFHVWQRCGRCVMTTIDRDTLQRGPEPLATLSTFREREHGMRNFGMHLIPVAGTITETSMIGLGDTVEVLEVDEERRAEWERLFGSSL